MRRLWCVPVLALAACQETTMERDQMGLWKSNEQIRREYEAAEKNAQEGGGGGGQPSGPARPAKVVTISAETAKAQENFIAQKATIFADAVDVDLSRDGWFAHATMSVSRDAVVRRDEEDASRGVLTITLQRIPNTPVTMESIPTVRFGEGLRIVGVDRVTLRFWTKGSTDRPMWFRAMGAGKTALYKVETDAPREWRGKTVDVRAEIHLVGEEYRFDSSADAKP